ncbi:MAG: winged helix-turn-helix transcriptional regulator [Alphaproteobacteria bacterium]
MTKKQTPSCPMEAILQLLMGPWTAYILYVLRDQGPQRFGALRRAVPGISTRVLTERLRMLQSAGVIWREQTQTIPPAVTYGMTARGEELGSRVVRKFYRKPIFRPADSSLAAAIIASLLMP